MTTRTQYHVISWTSSSCKQIKGQWYCAGETEAQALIHQLHVAGHQYISMKIETWTVR